MFSAAEAIHISRLCENHEFHLELSLKLLFVLAKLIWLGESIADRTTYLGDLSSRGVTSSVQAE